MNNFIINNFNNKNNTEFYLVEIDSVLYLRFKNNNWKDFKIDFSLYLERSKEFQNIIRAVNIKGNNNLKILDVTAGLGRDSFILASNGFKVTMLERNPIIYELLNNAINNGLLNNNLNNTLKNMELINIDSIQYLKNGVKNIDVIYIDPMFPKINKSRLVKKDMQILRKVVGDDADSTELLNLSLKQNIKKIVVKRMLKSPYLGEKKPSYEIKGNIARFDVYKNI